MPHPTRQAIVKLVAGALLGLLGGMLFIYLGPQIGLSFSSTIFLFQTGIGVSSMLLGIRRWFVPSPQEPKGAHLVYLISGAVIVVFGSFMTLFLRITEA